MGAEGVLQTPDPDVKKLPAPAVRQKTHGKDNYQHDAGNQRFSQGVISFITQLYNNRAPSSATPERSPFTRVIWPEMSSCLILSTR
jgi:hypothetical protein